MECSMMKYMHATRPIDILNPSKSGAILQYLYLGKSNCQLKDVKLNYNKLIDYQANNADTDEMSYPTAQQLPGPHRSSIYATPAQNG